MKIVGISILFFFILSTPVFADVVTGNSSSTSDVQTTIQGSGNVSTHIETSVNGKTQTFDSNQPGTYHVSMDATGTTAITSLPQATIAPRDTPIPSIILTPKIKLHTMPPKFFNLNSLQTFFHHLFSFL